MKGNGSFSYLEVSVLSFLQQDSADRLFHKVKSYQLFLAIPIYLLNNTSAHKWRGIPILSHNSDKV